MILLNGRRVGRMRRLFTLCVMAGFCVFSFAIGCNKGSQPSPSAASPTASASNSQNAPTPDAATSQPASQQSVTQVAPRKHVEKPKKPFSEMTAMEVAQNPAEYGFKKGGSMVTSPVNGSDLEPSRDDQWIKETKDGKVYILTIHYDKSGKMVYAKWGGF